MKIHKNTGGVERDIGQNTVHVFQSWSLTEHFHWWPWGAPYTSFQSENNNLSTGANKKGALALRKGKLESELSGLYALISDTYLGNPGCLWKDAVLWSSPAQVPEQLCDPARGNNSALCQPPCSTNDWLLRSWTRECCSSAVMGGTGVAVLMCAGNINIAGFGA